MPPDKEPLTGECASDIAVGSETHYRWSPDCEYRHSSVPGGGTWEQLDNCHNFESQKITALLDATDHIVLSVAVNSGYGRKADTPLETHHMSFLFDKIVWGECHNVRTENESKFIMVSVTQLQYANVRVAF